MSGSRPMPPPARSAALRRAGTIDAVTGPARRSNAPEPVRSRTMKRHSMIPTTSAPAHGLRIHHARTALASLVTLATIALVAGCGGDGVDQYASKDEARATTVTPGPVTAMPAVATPAKPADEGSRIVALGDSLPPEVTASIEHGAVNGGDVVEITA